MIISPVRGYDLSLVDEDLTVCPGCVTGEEEETLSVLDSWGEDSILMGWDVECPGEHGEDSDCLCGVPMVCDRCGVIL